jgi:hypothetical protein
MAGEQDAQTPGKGFIYNLLTKHRKSLRKFGIFLLVSTFIVKTEIRDHLKDLVDNLDRAEAKLSDGVQQTYVLQDFSLFSQHVSYIETEVESIDDATRKAPANSFKTNRDNPFAMRDMAQDMAQHATVQATQILITNAFTLVDAMPSHKNEYRKELLDYRARANGLEGSSGLELIKGAGTLGLSVQMTVGFMTLEADRWSVFLESVYHIVDVISIALYLLGGL